MRNEFTVRVTFDTPLYIPLLSLYFQIGQVLCVQVRFKGSCVILFLNVTKMTLHPGKKCHRTDSATMKSF